MSLFVDAGPSALSPSDGHSDNLSSAFITPLSTVRQCPEHSQSVPLVVQPDMPPSRPEPWDKLSRAAYKSVEVSGPLTAKAARKLQYPTESESSDHRSITSNQYDGESSYEDFSDTDSDVFQRPLNRDAKRDPARPTFVAKRAKHAARKVSFDVPNDSDSDSATVRAESSPRRVRQNLPVHPAIPQAPPDANRITQSGNDRAQKARRPAPNLDNIRDRLVKSVRVNEFRGVKLRKWGSKFTRKERKEGGRRYARMSIGSAGQRGSSQNPNVAPSQDKRRRWFFRKEKIGCRRNRAREPGNHEDVPQPAPQRAPKTVRGPQFAAKSARHPAVPSYESDTEGQSDDGNSFQDDDDFSGGPADEYMADTSRKDEEEALEHTKPSQSLLDGLEKLALSVVRLDKMRRLPFLRRNLRRGFQLHCRMVGIDIKPHPLPHTSISVVYNCPLIHSTSSEPGGIRNTTAKSSMKDWLCPLCDLHKKFHNPRMLEKHLVWDHPSAKVLWDDGYSGLSLTTPGSLPESNPVITCPVPVRELSALDLSSNSRHDERSKSADSDLKSLIRTSSTPSGVASESGFSTASTMPTSVETEDVKPNYVASGYSNRAVASTQTRSNFVSGRSVSQALLNADTQDGLRPSLVPPYLPETPDERGDVYYSCRPGGPRIFDFLNPLSLKDFGVLKWVIIDREEELFEVDDILDEDKVMLVLWYRWIFLNRNKFVANYFDGTKTFIEDNWELIKRGAGLLALRTWLLVLLVNNFLLPAEVAALMRYYQELANIRLY